MEPLVIAEQGHFFTGLRTHTGPAGPVWPERMCSISHHLPFGII